MATLLFSHEITMVEGDASYSPEDGDRTIRAWRLVYDVAPEDHDEIKNATGIPAAGTAYKPGDPRKLKRKRVSKLDSGLGYVVTCEYEAPPAGAQDENPLERPDALGGDFLTERVPYEKDSNGDDVKNTAGFLLDPRPTRWEGVFKLKIEGNRELGAAPLDVWAAFTRPAAYNDDAITIRGRTFAAHVLLILGMSFEIVVEGIYTFERWQWWLAVNPDGWHEEIYKSVGRDDIFGRIKMGEPPEDVSDPWPLNDWGIALPNADDASAEVTYAPYRAADFTAFEWTEEA